MSPAMSTLFEPGSAPILGKRKDFEPCQSESADPHLTNEPKAIKTAASENEEVSGCESEEEEEIQMPICDICLKDRHWSGQYCPYKRIAPRGTKTVGPDGTKTVGAGWRLVCIHCGSAEFQCDEPESCIRCGSSYKRAVRLVCAGCGVNGHLFEDCQYKDLIDLTSDEYRHNIKFYRPPCAGAQGGTQE